jgi:tRNA (cmo5U34)-methyltransferase
VAFQWEPSSYLELIAEEVPDYERLQEQAVAAAGACSGRVLELGVGTGETARRVLERNPAAILLGIDASPAMLAHARGALPPERAELRLARLEDELPAGPFELVISVLAVHHLDGAGKRDLFRRAAAVLEVGGRLVIGDLVVPDDPADVVTPIDGDYDRPSSLADQLAWLAAAGLEPAVAWRHRDLAVMTAVLPG